MRHEIPANHWQYFKNEHSVLWEQTAGGISGVEIKVTYRDNKGSHKHTMMYFYPNDGKRIPVYGSSPHLVAYLSPGGMTFQTVPQEVFMKEPMFKQDGAPVPNNEIPDHTKPLVFSRPRTVVDVTVMIPFSPAEIESLLELNYLGMQPVRERLITARQAAEREIAYHESESA